MALHEYMKDSKIIEEMHLYLLEKGYKEVTSSISIGTTATTFVFKVSTEGKDLSDSLQEDLYCCGDNELEEYGWELTDSHCVCELNALGMLVNDFTVVEEKGICEITLFRRKSTK